MEIKLKAPTLPESVSDGTIVSWHKQVGDSVRRDETLVDIETEKVVLEVPAPQDGVLKEVFKADGSIVTSEEAIAIIETITGDSESALNSSKSEQENKPEAPAQAWNLPPETKAGSPHLSPAARHLIKEHGLDSNSLEGTGKDGRLTKQDVLSKLKGHENLTNTSTPTKPTQTAPTSAPKENEDRQERREPMSRLRATIADRLVQAQHNAALLTTFNEINMQGIMDLRREHKQRFEEQHGVKLGLMSFFVKAVTQGLKEYPIINASVEKTDILYHDYYDIGIAVSSPRGLVVPVLRDADHLGFSDIEKAVAIFGAGARDATLTMDQLTGGTFTITNGGVFGSLLSTPIVNPPQSAILAMHKIDQRPVAENGEVCIRPMMYIALSYDHRIIDGRDAVQFLVMVKEALENPARLMLEI